MKPQILSTIFALCFLTFFAPGASANLEEFQIEDVQKQKVTLTQPKVLVYFWATWCPDCKEALKHKLPPLQKEDVAVLAVNTDADGEKVREYLKSEGVQIATLIDRDKTLRKKYAVFSVPTAVLFRKFGSDYKLQKTIVGADATEIKAELLRE